MKWLPTKHVQLTADGTVAEATEPDKYFTRVFADHQLTADRPDKLMITVVRGGPSFEVALASSDAVRTLMQERGSLDLHGFFYQWASNSDMFRPQSFDKCGQQLVVDWDPQQKKVNFIFSDWVLSMPLPAVNCKIVAAIHGSLKLKLACCDSLAPNSVVQPIHRSVSQSDFSEFLGNAMASGKVTFEIEGRELQADRLVLAARSEYFERMFGSAYSEATSERIKIKQTPFNAFKAMLRYIYSGGSLSASLFDDASALDLLHLSDEYLLPDLAKICEKKLLRGLTFETALHTYGATCELGDKVPCLMTASVNALKGRVAEIPHKDMEEFCKCPKSVQQLLKAMDESSEPSAKRSRK